MNYDEPEFTVGIEEEYLLVDRHSRDLIQEPPDEFFSQCESRLKGQVRPEFLKSQIEVGTTVCRTIGEARRELGWLRGEISSIAEKFDAAPIAAATHPFAQWQITGSYRQRALPHARGRYAGGCTAANYLRNARACRSLPTTSFAST